jgi:LPS export ABC transporter protein LptC
MTAGIAVLLLLFLGCSEPGEDYSAESGKQQTVMGFWLVQAQDGVRDWMLTGDSAVYREEDSLLTITGVHILFYREDIPESFIRSDTGTSDLLTGRTLLWGNVYAENTQGRNLTTDLILWIDSLNTFQTDCLVTFVIPESTGVTTLRGRGVTIDTGLGALGDIMVQDSFTAVTTEELPIND